MPVSDQGIQSQRYQIIPRVLIFLFNENGEVLLIRGAPTKRIWANRYNGIGGHVEPGEDVQSAARRELLEETGLRANDLRLCGTVLIDTGQNPGIGLFVFKGSQIVGDLSSGEEGQPEWFTVDQISQLPVVEDLPYLVPRVNNWQPGDAPFAARTWYDDQDQLRIQFSDSTAD